MTKFLATTISVAMLALASVATTSAPAQADNFHLSSGGFGGGWGHGGYGWGGGWGPGIVVNNGNWDDHVDWCYDHKGPSYDPQDNTYVNGNGKVKFCNSPFN